jgi:hypothetical protein
MTQSNGDRLDRVENEVINLKVATSAMLETIEVHQQNFEVIVAELQRDREQRRQEMTQTNARLIKLEEAVDDIRTILQVLTRRSVGD